MNIPTAEEELDEMFRETGFDIVNKIQRSMIISSMKLFAKMHVTEALKEANNKSYYFVDDRHLGKHRDSILNAYPLENIK